MRWGKWGADFSTQQYLTIIETCLEMGIDKFDHADIYGHYTTEAEFGKALLLQPSLRDKIQLISKCGIGLVSENRPYHFIKHYNTTAKHIMLSVENSLEQLNTDRLDVLLIHRPDPLMNLHEVAEAVSALQQQGKVLAFGVSNFLPHQLSLLQSSVAISYNQIELSLLETNNIKNGTLDYCYQHNIQPMAWASLGAGLLSDSTSTKHQQIALAAKHIAEKYSTGINQILIAWLLKHPSGILPIVGSTNIQRLEQAVVAQQIDLDNQDWYYLYSAALGREID